MDISDESGANPLGSKETIIFTKANEPEDLKAPKLVACWSNRLNNELNENLECLNPDDKKTIISNLEGANPWVQGRHIFFEVVLGAWLSRIGCKPRYEQKIDDCTPDWTLTVESCRAIIEVVNIDPAKAVKEQLNGMPIVYRGDRAQRLYETISEKAAKYRGLVELHRIPYIIAVCPNFAASLGQDDFLDVLQNEDYGIFRTSNHLSGVIVFESRVPQHECSYAEHWHFYYCENPYATNVWKAASLLAINGL